MIFKYGYKFFLNLIKIKETFNQNNIVFFSEGNNHWRYLKPFIESLILLGFEKKTKYITQSLHDEGINFLKNKIDTFVVGNGRICDYVLNNIKAGFFFTTSPDIGNNHIKKSSFCNHYIYIQHSLISLHMGYSRKAFFAYDSFFCAGNHHKREIKEIIREYNLPKKNLYDSIYAPFLFLRDASHKRNKLIKNILIAPTWGNQGIIESRLIFQYLDDLLNKTKFHITLRPHPETFKRNKKLIKELNLRYINHSRFNFDINFNSYESILNADTLITDWSGSAFDFAITHKWPIIFVNTQKKIHNSNYQEINQIPIEIRCRSILGKCIDTDISIVDTLNQIKLKRLINIDQVETFYKKNPKITMMEFLKKNNLL